MANPTTASNPTTSPIVLLSLWRSVLQGSGHVVIAISMVTATTNATAITASSASSALMACPRNPCGGTETYRSLLRATPANQPIDTAGDNEEGQPGPDNRSRSSHRAWGIPFSSVRQEGERSENPQRHKHRKKCVPRAHITSQCWHDAPQARRIADLHNNRHPHLGGHP